MKVVEIRKEAELQNLRSAWETLLRESGSKTIFLTWEWVTAWWSSYGKPGELRILTAFDESGALRGIAPLRFRNQRRYGQTVPTLTFLGDGSDDSDYLDFIVVPGFEQAVIEAFGLHWKEELNRGTALLLNEIPETSPNLPWLRALAGANQALWKETQVACGTVMLPALWEDYLSLLRPRFRTKVRSVLRGVEERPQVRFGFCRDPKDVERMLPILFDLHERRWAEEGKPGVFNRAGKRDFYFALSAALLERGWLRFSWLEWNGQVLACQYGFVHGGTYFHLQEGYEPTAKHWNVGVALRAWSIREFLKEGLGEYDFLGGVGRHKTDWGAKVKQSYRILMANVSSKNVLFCRGPEWETRARESVRRVMPEKLLSARQARLEQQALTEFQRSQNGHATPAGDEWIQRAIAQCYFHLKLPRLMRPFRNEYQVSISKNGGSPRFSWSRRAGPSARILYFHRVNDEGDPFFPAISTDLFEQEMRFVARHYKVVSLGQALDHLEGNSRETVLAITFDDGYQDNYLNAYPILQRYGLPATIFLTTGSLDNRDPLWFEQLADALKKTSLEFIDLELDIPRRFWLRTQAERLEANSQIFGRLRQLPDSQRREYLTQILRQLAAPPDAQRRNQMLTWDQVRLMKPRGIDFGGHTVTHPFLSKLRQEEVMWEASECKRRIEEELQTSVNYFAYPNGRDEDVGQQGKELICAAGYKAAVTTTWGLNYRSTDRMGLKRGGPWEESAAVFAYKLDWYQLVND